MKKIISFVCLLICAFFVVSCAHKSATQMAIKNENISVGKVQREIKIGMSSADVVEVLGSPNMVTTDDQRRETWVYDKISTEIDSSSSSSGVWLLFVGGGKDKKSSSSSQRTLTIIIKFDNNGKVRDFSYRTSSF